MNRRQATGPQLLIVLIAAVAALGIAIRIHTHHLGWLLTIAAGTGCFTGYWWALDRIHTAWTRSSHRR